MDYPPTALTLLALKQERQLEIYATDEDGKRTFITSYPILAASGGPGPKLQEGDRQVPEGIYPIEFLNPNSLYHLSLRIGYPNEFDRAEADKVGRTDLGGDIMIHGSAVSIGCLAMGDTAAEDIFIMAADCGIENTTVVIAPVDFRQHSDYRWPPNTPSWTTRLYREISAEIMKLPSREGSSQHFLPL